VIGAYLGNSGMVFDLAVRVVFRSRRKLSGTVAWLGCRLRRIAIGNDVGHCYPNYVR
jgi:hypothetical protein